MAILFRNKHKLHYKRHQPEGMNRGYQGTERYKGIAQRRLDSGVLNARSPVVVKTKRQGERPLSALGTIWF
jgi:hypothetical protein